MDCENFVEISRARQLTSALHKPSAEPDCPGLVVSNRTGLKQDAVRLITVDSRNKVEEAFRRQRCCGAYLQAVRLKEGMLAWND